MSDLDLSPPATNLPISEHSQTTLSLEGVTSPEETAPAEVVPNVIDSATSESSAIIRPIPNKCEQKDNDLPPVSASRKMISPHTEELRHYVEQFVSNFLNQSVKECLQNTHPPPSLPPVHQTHHFIPIYIQEMIHSVLENYLTNLSAHGTNIEPATHSETQGRQTEDEIMPSTTPPPGLGERSESNALTFKVYEEKILFYEARISELEFNYSKLQESTSEAHSSYSRKLLTLTEHLEAKLTEVERLQKDNNDWKDREFNMEKQIYERVSMLNEELCSVVYSSRLKSSMSECKIQELSEQLKYTQDDLSDTIEYYQVSLQSTQ